MVVNRVACSISVPCQKLGQKPWLAKTRSPWISGFWSMSGDRKIFMANLKFADPGGRFFSGIAGSNPSGTWMLYPCVIDVLCTIPTGCVFFVPVCDLDTSTTSTPAVNNCPTRCDYIQFYFISTDSSTCIGWHRHPSLGAHCSFDSSTSADCSKHGSTSARCCNYSLSVLLMMGEDIIRNM